MSREPSRTPSSAEGQPTDADDDVTASDVAAYAYCAKAWHLERVLEHRASRDAAERRDVGVANHLAHGATLQRVQGIGVPLRRVAVAFFALAVLLILAALLVGYRP